MTVGVRNSGRDVSGQNARFADSGHYASPIGPGRVKTGITVGCQFGVVYITQFDDVFDRGIALPHLHLELLVGDDVSPGDAHDGPDELGHLPHLPQLQFDDGPDGRRELDHEQNVFADLFPENHVPFALGQVLGIVRVGGGLSKHSVHIVNHINHTGIFFQNLMNLGLGVITLVDVRAGIIIYRYAVGDEAYHTVVDVMAGCRRGG